MKTPEARLQFAKKTVLVTGAAGYIGSHAVVKLLEAGADVLMLDNLCNSRADVIDRIAFIAKKKPVFFMADIRDRLKLREILGSHQIDSVLHFAGLKAVGESEADPLKYFDNNVGGTLVLLEEMAKAQVKTIVFSSSATVYGEPGVVRYTEDLPLKPVNVYGRTKLVVEDILRDLSRTDPAWKIALLRYFNPVGAHESGMLGEDPLGVPNNLMPFIAQVAAGRRDRLKIFGNDYPTMDGTGKRDYIHVEDLAAGHIAALDFLNKGGSMLTVNLGSGQPHSVLDMVQAFARASGCKIDYEFVGRRPGDLAEYFADPTLAHKLLGWKASLGIDRMCQDTWLWQQYCSSMLRAD